MINIGMVLFITLNVTCLSFVRMVENRLFEITKEKHAFCDLDFSNRTVFFTFILFSFKSETKKEIYWKKNFKDVSKLRSSPLKNFINKKIIKCNECIKRKYYSISKIIEKKKFAEKIKQFKDKKENADTENSLY